MPFDLGRQVARGGRRPSGRRRSSSPRRGASASLTFSALRPSVITCQPGSRERPGQGQAEPGRSSGDECHPCRVRGGHGDYLQVQVNLSSRGLRMDARDLLPMGEVARRSGFAASAIRFYEAEGLIEAHRSGGGQRRFERSVLRRLAFIRAACNVGLSHRGDPRRARPSARQPHPHQGRLAPHLEALAARGSTSRSPRCNASRAASTAASGAAASASAPAPSPTPATSYARARVRARGLLPDSLRRPLPDAEGGGVSGLATGLRPSLDQRDGYSKDLLSASRVAVRSRRASRFRTGVTMAVDPVRRQPSRGGGRASRRHPRPRGCSRATPPS